MGLRKYNMKRNYININNLKITDELYRFVNDEILKDTNISPEKFWSGFDKSVHEFAPKNKELLKLEKIYKIKLMNGISKTREMKLKLRNIKVFKRDWLS